MELGTFNYLRLSNKKSMEKVLEIKKKALIWLIHGVNLILIQNPIPGDILHH